MNEMRDGGSEVIIVLVPRGFRRRGRIRGQKGDEDDACMSLAIVREI